MVIAQHSSKSNEWYTPPEVIDAVRLVLGRIELDPASCALANAVVQAERYYTAEDNGLHRSWKADTLFLNPPYGKDENVSNQSIWSKRLLWEYRMGMVREAVLLVNAATDTDWFAPLTPFTVCFTKRIKFYSPSGTHNQPTHGNAVVYFGQQESTFIDAFLPFGFVYPAGVVRRGAA